MKETNWFVLRFHAVFFLLASVVLSPCLLQTSWNGTQQENAVCERMGHSVSCLVLGWNAAFAIWTYYCGYKKGNDGNDDDDNDDFGVPVPYYYKQLFVMWGFVCTLSVLQVIPDWFLVTVLQTLHFPNDGAYKIGGAVSWYMAGMWSIPFLWILLLSGCLLDRFDEKKDQMLHRQQQNKDSVSVVVRAAVIALVIFGASEQVTYPLNLWHCTDRVQHTIGHVALYVLPAEAFLGSALVYAFQVTRYRHDSYYYGWQVIGAIAVMLLYTGALAVSYLFIEGT